MKIIYYPFPVPVNRYTISILGILFDKVLLPGVYLPSKTLNKRDLKKEAERLISIQKRSPESHGQIMIALVKFLEEYQELIGIFEGTIKTPGGNLLEPESMDLAKGLEKTIFGEPPKGFTPTITHGIYFGVQGASVNSPDWLTYPANAYVSALKEGIPLFTDKEDFPTPRILPHNSSVDNLISYLALSTLSMNLPRIRPLKAEEILEIREKMKGDIENFKAAMAEYADKFRQLVGENPSLNKLQKEADYITKAIIQPKLRDLTKKLETPGEIFKSEMFDATLDATTLIARAKINPSPDNLLELVGETIEMSKDHIKNGVSRYIASKKFEKDSGLSLVLKLPRKYK